MTAPALSLLDLGLAALLILANAAVSLIFRLRLERSLVVAAVRMVVQLALVGYVLKLVFEQSSPVVTAAVGLVMVVIAAIEARARQTDPLGGPIGVALGALALLAVGVVTTVYATRVVIAAEHWYAPSVVLPILGMILGNTLTGVSLALETLTQTAKSERTRIEARLAMGHSRRQAFEQPLRRAMTTAMIPMINSMAISGIVTLPGMMTGQILSGVDPVEAAKYQIMIMFVLAGATAVGVVTAGVGGLSLLTDSRSRLRLDRLTQGGAGASRF